MSNQNLLNDNLADNVRFTLSIDALTDNPGNSDNDPSVFNVELKSNPNYYLNQFGKYDSYCIQPWIAISDGTYSADLYYSTEDFAINTLVDLNQDENVDEPFVLTDDLLQASVFTLNNLTWEDLDSDGDLEGIISDGQGGILASGLEIADIQYLVWYQLYGLYTPDYPGFNETPYGDRTLDQASNAALAASIDAVASDYVPQKAGDKVGIILLPDDGSQFVLSTVELSGLGDYVWLDANENGIQDSDESGVEGVVVELLADLNNNGEIEIGEVLQTTITDQHGFYAFDGIIADNYLVHFVKPEGNDFTIQDANSNFGTVNNSNGDDSTDSDVNSNGLTQLISLTPGEFNDTIDAGLISADPDSEPPPQGDVTQIFGQAQAITFNYLPSNTVQTGGKKNSQDGKAKIEDGSPDNDSSAYIVVASKEKVDEIQKGDAETYFAGNVEVGESFTASVDFLNGDGDFKDDIRILIFDNEDDFLADNDPLQEMKYRTKGDQPIEIGDKVGSVEVAEYFGQTGFYDASSIDPIDGGINRGFQLNKIFGSPRVLTFEYGEDNSLVTSQEDEDASILVENGIEDDSTSYIIISNEQEGNDARNGQGYNFFAGEVSFGETIETTVMIPGTSKAADEIYIHYFDSITGQLLRSVEYNTKGDKDIGLGDNLAGLTLTGYSGRNGSILDPDAAQDADVPETFPQGDLTAIYGQPQALTLTYIPGDIVLTGGKNNNQDGKAKIEDGSPDNDLSAYIVVASKEKVDEIQKGGAEIYFAGNVEVGESFTASVDFLNGGGDFKDDIRILIFDSEGQFLAAEDPLQDIKYRAKGDQPIQIGDRMGSVEVSEYFGMFGSYDDLNIDPIDGEINRGFQLNEVLGKPQALTFEYNNSDTLLTNQENKDAQILFNNGIDNDGTSRIIITDEDNANKALNGIGREYFVGDVSFGNIFEATITNAGTEFKDKTYVHYFDNASGGLLRSVQYRAKGDKDILFGDQLSGLELIGYVGEDGSTGVVL